MARNDVIVDLGAGEYEVSIMTETPHETMEWINENCPREYVVSVVSYITKDDVYRLKATFRDIVPATHFKLYWHGHK